MIVFYEPENLSHFHVVSHYPPDYTEHLVDAKQHWVQHDEVIPFPEIYLSKDADGEIKINRRTPAPEIVMPAALALNAEAPISGIPEGTDIFVNGEKIGTMDASGVLEFTAQTAGTYKFRFEAPGAMPKETSLEVRS